MSSDKMSLEEIAFRQRAAGYVADVYAGMHGERQSSEGARRMVEAVLQAQTECIQENFNTLNARLFEPGPNHANGLTFNALRAANTARCPMFKNAKGETQHSGRDWSPNDWMVATGGELGEAMNVMKKVRRGDMTLGEARPKLAREFSDVVIYLDMLARECGVNLGEAISETFNAKSLQLELDLYITDTGYIREHRE